MPLKQKTAKAQQETPETKLRHKSFASPTRNKKIQSREPNKTITCHHRSNKQLRKPNRKPPKQKHKKKLLKPDARQNKKSTARAHSTKHYFLETKQIKNDESPTPDPESTTQFRHNNATARAQQNVPLSPQRPRELRKPNKKTGCLDSPTPAKKTALISPTRN